MTVEGDDTKLYVNNYNYCRKKDVLPIPKKEIPMPPITINLKEATKALNVKPPLGVPSLEIHRALRIKDLSRAVTEHIEHKKAVKPEWIDELKDLVKEHNQWIKSIPRKVGNPNYTG